MADWCFMYICPGGKKKRKKKTGKLNGASNERDNEY